MKILPLLNKIFKSGKTVVKAAEKKANVEVTPPVFVKSSAAATETVKPAKENPFLEYIYDSYKQDGVSREVVDRVVLGGERLRYYRYVGDDELQKLLSGRQVASSRPCHGGRLTDVTSDPNYGKIPTLGKYRLTFKDKPEFAPYPLGNEKNSRIIEHNLGNSEFYLCGGYSIDDIEKIEQKVGPNSFKLLDLFG